MREHVLFDAVLEPNRPLAPRHMFALLCAVAFISFCAGIMFVLRGAWPVTPFFGADLALLAWAFRATSRAARRRERVTLTHDSLTITRMSPEGRVQQEALDPYWMRVDHQDPELVGAELALVARGRRCVIGSFLGAEDRASLAAALRDALQRARSAHPA